MTAYAEERMTKVSSRGNFSKHRLTKYMVICNHIDVPSCSDEEQQNNLLTASHLIFIVKAEIPNVCAASFYGGEYL